MSGYELSRAFFDWSFENPELNTATHTALYMFYIDKWNRCGQKEKFSVTTSEAMDAIGVRSRKTISKAFKSLIEWGFVKVVTKAKNQNSCNIISLAQKMSKQEDSKRTALDKSTMQNESACVNFAQAREQQVHKQMPKHGNSTVTGTGTINKQVNKETSKQLKVGETSKEKPEDLELPFSDLKFQNAYLNWIKMRRENKLSIKIPHLKRLLAKLATYNTEFASRQLECAVLNGWKGLIYQDTDQKYQQFLKTKSSKNQEDSISDAMKKSREKIFKVMSESDENDDIYSIISKLTG
ncbi:MAG: hypothetical protein ACFB0B_15515 [Thermonemataceae bacterium]